MYQNREKPYYLVWTPRTCHTRKRHKTLESAQAEAQRLADEKGFKFHILMGFSFCTPDSSITLSNEVE